jgi:hypothetical protein
MGIFDTIRCEMPLPDGRAMPDDGFQTKSLSCSMEHYTITADGRLIHHRRSLLPASGKKSLLPERQADIEVDFHGDIEIYGSMPDGFVARYAVRFTHGKVEWIQPFDALRHHHQWHPYHDY